MLIHILKEIKGVEITSVPRMTYNEAMQTYGNDKPDIRFDMKFVELDEKLRGTDFKVFTDAELVVGIRVDGKLT